MKRRRGLSICYICGQQLTGKLSVDHIPPKQFYATTIRKQHNPNLLTLPVHVACNESFKKDEEYFVQSIGPMAGESYSGSELWKDIKNRSRKPELKNLFEKVYYEFDERPSGLILPKGKVLKRFDGTRVWRVVWKITRGLFFKEKGIFLPDKTPRTFDLYSPGETPKPIFQCVVNEPSRGQYQGVFDYKYTQLPKLNNFHFWAMLFWNQLIMQIGFHDPHCPCEKCQKTHEKEII